MQFYNKIEEIHPLGEIRGMFCLCMSLVSELYKVQSKLEYHLDNRVTASTRTICMVLTVSLH
jgi:hypothetical protein